MKGKSLDPERNEAARGLAKRLVATDFEGNVNAAAKAFGVSQSMLYEFLDGKRGAGMKLLEGIATYRQCTLDEVIGRPLPEPTRTELDIALRFYGAEMPEPVVAEARAEEAAGVRRIAREWGRWMVARKRALYDDDEGDGEKMVRRIEAEAAAETDAPRAKGKKR
jgi:hypothetical protein